MYSVRSLLNQQKLRQPTIIWEFPALSILFLCCKSHHIGFRIMFMKENRRKYLCFSLSFHFAHRYIQRISFRPASALIHILVIFSIHHISLSKLLHNSAPKLNCPLTERLAKRQIQQRRNVSQDELVSLSPRNREIHYLRSIWMHSATQSKHVLRR